MNIKEAKEEILRTIRAYRRKDETGAYEIPTEQQRPILLIGPPGIGKTAVMGQIAQECGIGLVSYTITHHTRQSAIGLPMISHHSFDGKDTAVTEYTMSEIVASIYEKMERTGVREGILFLDEINCVSETLAPTMLQFLQYKTFGAHRVPEGWIIVTAGNQPQYNRSARKFDIVTLDRVKKMEIEADYGTWKEYAVGAGVHGAILSYLDIKPSNFYRIRTELDDRHFVTARGWEDLSRMIVAYEKMGEAVSEVMAVQYLQDPEIARDFALYYDLYRKYRDLYRVKDILAGTAAFEREELQNLPFDEKLSLIRLLADGLHQEFVRCNENQAVQEMLYGQLVRLQGEGPDFRGAVKFLQETRGALGQDLQIRQDAGMMSREKEKQIRLAMQALGEAASLLEERGVRTDSSLPGQEAASADPFPLVKEWFAGREDRRQEESEETGAHLTNVFAFLHQNYGTGQEMVLFLTALNEDQAALKYLQSEPSDSYGEFSRLLLLRDRREELKRAALTL